MNTFLSQKKSLVGFSFRKRKCTMKTGLKPTTLQAISKSLPTTLNIWPFNAEKKLCVNADMLTG